MEMKPRKIINIMCHPPAYNLFWNDPKPEINWDTPDGKWVGVWGKDWAELIGKEVLKLSDEFIYEVWQPDLRADKIYTHTFSDGLVRRLFPAVSVGRFYGLKKRKYVFSQSICRSLAIENMKNEIVVHLNGVHSGISRSILSLTLDCPVAAIFLGEVKPRLHSLITFKKNMLGKLNDIQEYFILKKMFDKIDFVGYCNEKSRDNLRAYFRGEGGMLHAGIDCNIWKRRRDKSNTRRKLGLDGGALIVLSSARFNSLKQIDRMISILEDLDRDGCHFQYVVTGHGDLNYEVYLTSVGKRLIAKNKLKFVGFLPEEKLVEYYNAADLFAITSLSEGAPVSAIKALAMELPVFSTNTGLVAEHLLKYHAGVVVPLRDYKAWKLRLKDIFNGQKVRTIDRNIVKSLFHWPNVASRYVEMYSILYKNYYCG